MCIGFGDDPFVISRMQALADAVIGDFDDALARMLREAVPASIGDVRRENREIRWLEQG